MNIIEYSNRGSRTENQDYVIHRSLSADSAIFVLADGMGGYSHGEIASQTVAESIVEYVEQNTTNYTPENLLRESIVFANDALMIKRMEIGGKKMGTVIAVLFIKGTYAYITWLGDSSINLARAKWISAQQTILLFSNSQTKWPLLLLSMRSMQRL